VECTMKRDGVSGASLEPDSSSCTIGLKPQRKPT
jgi:hypothetical protein